MHDLVVDHHACSMYGCAGTFAACYRMTSANGLGMTQIAVSVHCKIHLIGCSFNIIVFIVSFSGIGMADSARIEKQTNSDIHPNHGN